MKLSTMEKQLQQSSGFLNANPQKQSKTNKSKKKKPATDSRPKKEHDSNGDPRSEERGRRVANSSAGEPESKLSRPDNRFTQTSPKLPNCQGEALSHVPDSAEQATVENECVPSKCLGMLAEILTQIVSFLCRYNAFRCPEQPTVIALWIAHSHALNAFDYTAYLHIQSPEKRCGKSLLLECCNLLVPRPWLCISPSEAVVCRKIATSCPTLLLDEVDTIFGGAKDQNKEGLRALLNAGFYRGATVPRCKGAHYGVIELPIFCAKVLAGIGKLPDTVADRSIPIVLARKAREQLVERFRVRDAAPHAEGIRAALEKWAGDSAIIGALRSARPPLPDALGDRQQDISEPLLAIADMAGGNWPDDARRALTALFDAADPAGESVGVILLTAIREIFADKNETKLPTETLLKELIARDEGPWASWWAGDIQKNNSRGPSSKLAKLLRAFGIASATIREGGVTMKGYKAECFADAWARYLPPPK